MEFKTCEQYVLAQLEDAQNKVEDLKADLAERDRIIKLYKSLITLLSPELKENGSIDVDNLYSWNDGHDELINLLVAVGAIPSVEKKDE